jgi:hypothetical protein
MMSLGPALPIEVGDRIASLHVQEHGRSVDAKLSGRGWLDAGSPGSGVIGLRSSFRVFALLSWRWLPAASRSRMNSVQGPTVVGYLQA